MLRKLIIHNFKCFKNKTVLDFRKTNYKFLEQNTYGKILKGALFVGDHASGKTTVLQSVKLLSELLFWERGCDLTPYQCIFSKENVSSLTYEFEIDGHELTYFLTFSGNSFLEEKLRIDGRTLVERLGKKGKWLAQKETVLCDVEDSVLFLKDLSLRTEFSSSNIVGKWFAYLKKYVYIDAYARRIEVFDGDGLSARRYAEAHGTKKINDFLQEHQFPFFIRYCEKEEERKEIFFERKGMEEMLPACMESTGNRILINLLPAVLSVTERGGALIIDSFGGDLHNRLEELLIRYVMEQGTNVQFFLSSHSTNLLSNSLLRPDQIFSMELAGGEGRRLHRFSDQQPRVAQNLEKMYLNGTFGELPEYKKI